MATLPHPTLTNGQQIQLPPLFLNAYEFKNIKSLEWPVSLYRVQLSGGHSHEDRGEIKNIIWKLRKQHQTACKGYGFVIDCSSDLVAVPKSWRIPTSTSTPDYSVTFVDSFQASAREYKHKSIIMGILREGIKDHFKKNSSTTLGNLWRDYGDFCQYPRNTGDEYQACKKFGCSVKLLRDGRWILQTKLSTTTVDGRTLADYFSQGSGQLLEQRIHARVAGRFTRENRPISVRVVHQGSTDSSIFAAYDLASTEGIFRAAALSVDAQRSYSRNSADCITFPQGAVSLPLSELRLILGSEITQEDHGDTILEPQERAAWMKSVRDFVDGASIFGQLIEISDSPSDTSSIPTLHLLPPDVCVKGALGGIEVLPAPARHGEFELRQRARRRSDSIRNNGFVYQRPANPLIAWPSKIRRNPAGERFRDDVNEICQEQGLGFRFAYALYESVGDIVKAVEAGGHDTVLAVLPENSRRRYSRDDTHELLKRQLEVPSQCIHADHTLPQQLANRTKAELTRIDPRTAHRIQQRYELCVMNLLVKHHCFPFLPATPFGFNVQVGLDVGGVHNTAAVACIGYGFTRPLDHLIFRPEEIPIDVQKKEPIPTEALYQGLLDLFRKVASELQLSGVKPDFETLIFYRDGKLLGDGDEWNEVDAIRRLHRALLQDGTLTNSSVWCAVEIMKGAEGWRVFRNNGAVTNPLVGTCLFPFEDDRTGLICTTGAPYLSQGTANPIMFKITDISGTSDRKLVAQDLFWQSDLCFTKPDIGMSLPWVLDVAGKGALQLSRSYFITGITA